MKKALTFDWILVAAIGLLVGISLLILYSITLSQAVGASVGKQSIFVGVGALAMAFFAFLDYRIIARNARAIYFVTTFFLLGVLLFGTNVRGTVGWIVIGPFSIQIVEFAKVALIIFLARFIAMKQSVFGPVGRLSVSLSLTTILVTLVLLQPDFGSAMVLLSVWFGMLLVSGMKKRHLFALVVLICVAGTGTWFNLAEYQQNRIFVFLDPYSDPRGTGYNVIQAMIAVGSGGITGKGLGNGTQNQLQFLPERHTDFIFAVIAEELGFVGVLFVLFLISAIIFRLWRIALTSSTNTGYLIVSGVLIMFFVQVVINVGMNVGLLPVTGIPLPFVSSGGSSLLAMSIAFGIVLSVDRRNRRTRSVL